MALVKKRLFPWILQWEPVWTLFLGSIFFVPARFVPESLLPTGLNFRLLILIPLLLVWPIRHWYNGRFTRRTPFDPLWLLLLLLLPLSYWATPFKETALEQIVGLVYGAALFYAVVNWQTGAQESERLWLLLGSVGALFIIATPFITNLAFNRMSHLTILYPALVRLAELAPGNVNENRMAGVIVLFIPLFLAMFLERDRRRLERAASLVLAGIGLGLIVLTQSRAGLVGVLFGISLVLALRLRILRIVLPIFFGVLLVVWSRTEFDLLTFITGGLGLSGIDLRVEIWQRGLYAITDFPFTGIGFGSFSELMPVLYPLFSVADEELVAHVHMLLMQVWLDVGVVGFLAFLSMQLLLTLGLIRLMRRPKSTLDWTLGVGLAGGFAAMHLQGLLDAPLWGSKVSFIPWLLAGSITLLAFKERSIDET